MKVTIIVHPNSKKPRIEKDLLDITHIYVREPALEGKANKAVIKALAKEYNVAKSSVVLIAGARSKIKVFKVGV